MSCPVGISEVFVIWWIVFVLFVCVVVFNSPHSKGWSGEAFVKLSARARLPVKSYYRIHNVTLPTPDGTTQIDHIFVSRFGIFVVETKNMRGWIFGREKQAQWTQTLYKKSFKFQNPLRQNYKHVKALESLLDVPPKVIHSVVVFVGNSTFKSPVPANVTKGRGYIAYIRSFSEPVLSESQVEYVVSKIKTGRLKPTRDTDRQHVQRLKRRENPLAKRKCPRCGSIMVLRTAKRGASVGNEFWGCSAYPKCRVVQSR